MGKRKRPSSSQAYEDDPLIGQTFMFEAEPEEVAPRGGNGSQVLPVAELEDFEGTPEDGEVYLSMVRKEAAGLEDVCFVARSYPTPPPSASTSRLPPPKPQLRRPSDEWRSSFATSFKRMRRTLRQEDESPVLTDLSYLAIPDAEDESAWHSYIYGKATNATAAEKMVAPPTPESSDGDAERAGSDVSTEGPKEPNVAMLSMLNTSTVFALIEHFDTWIQERLVRAQSGPSTAFVPPALRKRAAATPAAVKTNAPPAFSVVDGQWLFALLATLDDLLAGEELDQLRRLARTCLSVLAAEPSATADDDARAGCWIVVAAVTSVWAQHDLWQET